MQSTIVSHAEWLEAREALLASEKELTRLRDEVSRQRQQLPWEKIEKTYAFEGSRGALGFADLFDGCSQLIVYHFMFGPDWDAGCPSCSFLADHFDPAIVHLRQRDVSLVAVSSAPFEKLARYRKRMGWHFPWVSSLGTDFNRDYGVSFTRDEVERGDTCYNYRAKPFPSTEAPGISVFYRNDDGAIYHTYSTYERGLDMFLTTYHYLDLVPKGRDEDRLAHSMAWIRRHDEYA